MIGNKQIVRQAGTRRAASRMWWTSAIIAMGGRRRLCRGCLFLTKADISRPLRRIGSPAGSARHFIIIIVIRHETTAAARWALLLIVSTLLGDPWTAAFVDRLRELAWIV